MSAAILCCGITAIADEGDKTLRFRSSHIGSISFYVRNDEKGEEYNFSHLAEDAEEIRRICDISNTFVLTPSDGETKPPKTDGSSYDITLSTPGGAVTRLSYNANGYFVYQDKAYLPKSVGIDSLREYVYSLNEDYKLDLDADENSSLEFHSGGGNGRPRILTDIYYMSHFDYKTSKRSEIEYVAHMLNSMTFIDDGRTIMGADGIDRTIRITYSDGEDERLYFGYGRLGRGGKQYAADRNTVGRIFDDVYGFKTEKTVLPETVDFAPDAWAEDEIDAAIEAGLLPEEYRVNYAEPINRIDACRLLDNLTAAKGVSREYDYKNRHRFDDISDDSAYRLCQAGIISGKSETEFAPYDLITREETAKIISRAADILGIELDDTPAAVYNDGADMSDWAKTDINKVTNAGLMNGDENGGFRPKDNITRRELAIILLRLSQI